MFAKAILVMALALGTTAGGFCWFGADLFRGTQASAQEASQALAPKCCVFTMQCCPKGPCCPKK